MGTEIRHIGHTTFLVSRGESTLLLDPLLVHPSTPLREPGSPCSLEEGCGDAGAVVISHSHDDHLHPPSLLSLPHSTPVYCYGSAVLRQIAALGFDRCLSLEPGVGVHLGEGIQVTAIPAADSADGVEQCALIVETPDVVMLDAVDIRDTPVIREGLARYRGSVDIAFLPVGASLQWQGYWNQMDPIQAADLAEWLDARLVSACGGALSMSGSRRLGALERYPTGRAEWLASAVERLEPTRLLWKAPPVRLEYEKHEVRHIGSRGANRLQQAGAPSRIQSLLTIFFCGYHPYMPMQRFRGERQIRLHDQLQAWQPFRETIAYAVERIAHLLERCGETVNQTPAALLAPTTLRHLLRSEAALPAARLAALLPEPARDFAETAARFFDHAEAVLLGGGNGKPETLVNEALVCLDFDRKMALLAAEHRQMVERGGKCRGDAQTLINEHIAELRRTGERRRPVLAPNHIWVDGPALKLVAQSDPSEDVEALLYYAHPEGVKVLALNDVETLILHFCDSRTVPQVALEVARRLGADIDVAETAVRELLARLTRESIQLIEWSAG